LQHISDLIVAPGFIDYHTHVQTTIHEHPLAENITRQGITTLIAMHYSGRQPSPSDEYVSCRKVAPNVSFYCRIKL
jgi:N-acyl-D-amino-acid deacylase